MLDEYPQGRPFAAAPTLHEPPFPDCCFLPLGRTVDHLRSSRCCSSADQYLWIGSGRNAHRVHVCGRLTPWGATAPVSIAATMMRWWEPHPDRARDGDQVVPRAAHGHHAAGRHAPRWCWGNPRAIPAKGVGPNLSRPCWLVSIRGRSTRSGTPHNPLSSAKCHLYRLEPTTASPQDSPLKSGSAAVLNPLPILRGTPLPRPQAWVFLTKTTASCCSWHLSSLSSLRSCACVGTRDGGWCLSARSRSSST